MRIDFATCERNRALEYLKQVYPSRTILDTEDCAKPLLNLVEKDIVRIQDPMMYGTQIAIIEGKNYKPEMKEEILKSVSILLKEK